MVVWYRKGYLIKNPCSTNDRGLIKDEFIISPTPSS